MSVEDYITATASKHAVYMPHTAGRYQAKRFRKAQCPIVERLTNSLMMHGRNNGKKLMAVRIIKHAMEIIHLLTDLNPIQVIVDTVINSGPREDATRIGFAGVVRRQAVDISPLFRVNQAIYLLTTGARESAFRNVKTIAEPSKLKAPNSRAFCSLGVQIEERKKLWRDAKCAIIMRISNNSYYTTTHNLFRYFCLNCTLLSSFSRKTLNPNTPLHTVCPSKSLCAITYVSNSSSGSSSFFSFESNTLQKSLSLGTSSFRPASKCIPNPYIPGKNNFISSLSSWSSSRCKFESYTGYKKQSLCYFSSGCFSKKNSLMHSSLQSLGSSTLLKHNSDYKCSRSRYFYSANLYRCFSTSSFNGAFGSTSGMESEVQGLTIVCPDQQKIEKSNKFLRKFVLEIIDDIRNNRNDLESRLSVVASGLSVYSITEIFEALNTRRVSGLRFFEWIWINLPQMHKNAHICSLIIDNNGRLGDFETMFTLLKKFTSKNICLTYEAFGFLPVIASTKSSLTESTKRVVDLLNKVGGSCRNSGVCALVEMFCKLYLFEMARYVINITESKQSYYHLLIREMCRRGLTEDAHGIIREMGTAHCAPNTTVYNYLLGSLCTRGQKDEASALLDEMKEIGIPPDAITFEILINFECKLGKMDGVHNLLNEMASLCLEPRLSTHAVIVKSLFSAKNYKATYKYVVDSSIVYKTSSNMIYSLLANLYWEKGDIMSARNTLVEMIEKNLKPKFSIYVKIVKQLRRIGRTILARDLQCRHSKFVIKSRGSHL